MRSALIHGALLAVMLIYGYRTWTRDKTVQPDLGSVVLWEKSEGDLVSIEYKTEKKTTRIERKGEGADAYWWGTETALTKKMKPPVKAPGMPQPGPMQPKPPTPPAPPMNGSGAGSAAPAPHPAPAGAGSNAAAGSAAPPKAKSVAGSGAGFGFADANGANGSGSAAPAPKKDEPKKDEPKKDEPKNAGSGSGAGSGSAAGSGSGAGSGSNAAGSNAPPAPAPPGPVEKPVEEEIKTVKEFPLGENGDKLIKEIITAHALRDLGTPTEDQKKDFKLNDAKTTLTITFRDGAKTFLIGGSVYGGSDRYALDEQSHKAYVLSKDMLSGLETGESALHLTDPRGSAELVAKIAQVTIEAGGKSKHAEKIQASAEGTQVKTWGDPDTGKSDQTLANFIDEVGNLKPTEYKSDVTVASLNPVVKLSYRDEHGSSLGTFTLYKREKPPEADKPDAKPETEYYVVTEKSRVPGLVTPKDRGARVEQDVPTAFSEHPAGEGSGSAAPANFKFNPGNLAPQQPPPGHP